MCLPAGLTLAVNGHLTSRLVNPVGFTNRSTAAQVGDLARVRACRSRVQRSPRTQTDTDTDTGTGTNTDTDTDTPRTLE